ncbi:uncharacterized protein LOC123875261 [Maniola jurtina]|uniref:uncharacterized protein LOC123875261 n=1 Tax=Maniola jurtina TaxID=191418 RepID=UPI001E68DC9F|nr:uncharacterized protein LOC123875261 [Maniola jurtina]
MNTSERASHPSRAQIESLLEYLQRNPSLAKGFSKVPSARDATRRSWEALALQLNSLGGCVKTSKQWIKVWKLMLCLKQKTITFTEALRAHCQIQSFLLGAIQPSRSPKTTNSGTSISTAVSIL